jgi:hypothetical protein
VALVGNNDTMDDWWVVASGGCILKIGLSGVSCLYLSQPVVVCLNGDIDTMGSVALSFISSCGYVKGVCAY